MVTLEEAHVPLDMEALAALDELKRAERETETVYAYPAPARPACPLHPDWVPTKVVDFAPNPPSCPYCAEGPLRPAGQSVLVTSGGPLIPRREVPHLDRRWEEHKRELKEAGAILPDSDEELFVIETMDDAREQERIREVGAGPTWQKFENGRIITGRRRTKLTSRRPRRFTGSDAPFSDEVFMRFSGPENIGEFVRKRARAMLRGR